MGKASRDKRNRRDISRNNENDSAQQTLSAQIHTQSIYQGPIPSGDEMLKYAQIDPEFASRVIAMAEKESEHRRQIESAINDANIANSYKSLEYNARLHLKAQWFASGTTVIALLVSLGLSAYGNFWASGIVGTTTIIAIISAFLYQKRSSK
jgi:uncharacterized membrane protein